MLFGLWTDFRPLHLFLAIVFIGVAPAVWTGAHLDDWFGARPGFVQDFGNAPPGQSNGGDVGPWEPQEIQPGPATWHPPYKPPETMPAAPEPKRTSKPKPSRTARTSAPTVQDTTPPGPSRTPSESPYPSTTTPEDVLPSTTSPIADPSLPDPETSTQTPYPEPIPGESSS